MTERIFCLLLRSGQKQNKKLEIPLFLACLLVPLTLADRSHFYLVLLTLALGLTIGLAICRMKFIGGEVAIGLSR